jgi:hypothetical protein
MEIKVRKMPTLFKRTSIMKHLQQISRPTVSRAQMGASGIMNIVGTVLSTVGALLLTLSPILGKAR